MRYSTQLPANVRAHATMILAFQSFIRLFDCWFALSLTIIFVIEVHRLGLDPDHCVCARARAHSHATRGRSVVASTIVCVEFITSAFAVR